MAFKSDSPFERYKNFLDRNLLDIENRDDLSHEEKSNQIIQSEFTTPLVRGGIMISKELI